MKRKNAIFVYAIAAGSAMRGLDLALIRELEETRKAFQEAKALFARDTGNLRIQRRVHRAFLFLWKDFGCN